MKNNPARQKALADAAAGVIGSLVSVLVFYPVDVWKTNLQAGKHPSHDANESEDVNDVVLISTNETVKLNSATISQWLLRVSRIFRGLSYKITHTTVSSFAYFFVYSLVQSQYLAYRRSALLQHHSNNDKSIRIPVFTKLVLAAFSAVINTSITLPLDTLASRMQAGTHEIMHDTAAVDNNENEREECNNNTADSNNKSQLYINSPEEFKFSFSTNLRDEAFTAINPIKVTQKNANTHLVERIQSITSLWNGIFPATLLCTNPAIQYTMYDSLKSWFLRHNTQQHVGTTASSANNTQLSMSQSFLFGLVSKFVATVMTYPLIRAKVIMMVDTHSRNSNDVQEDDERNDISKKKGAHNDEEKAPSTSRRTTIPNSLLLLLMYIYKKDGVAGLYKGLSLQLLHTALKSALLLMVREKITVATRRFFEVE